MSKTTIEAWRCDKCQWIWVSDTKPDRCAKCKSRTWDLQINEAIISTPIGQKIEIKIPPRWVVAHDTKACRLYGCLMCKAAKEN